MSFIVENTKKSCGCLMSVHDAACYTGLLLLVLPSLNRTEGQSERAVVTSNRKKKKIAEEVGLFFFEGSLEIYTACFPLGNTCGLSALLCLLKHVVRSACKGQETTELCFIVVGLLAHMYMWSLNPNYVV